MAIDVRDCIEILKEEYRCLYDLVGVRVAALDQRALVTTAALPTFLGSFAAVGEDARAALLLGVPLSIVWFVRTTQTHAQAFEDAVRRIEAIERSINHFAGRELILFQSSHPSRGKAVGGRTGTEAMVAAVATSLTMLVACASLSLDHLLTSSSTGLLQAGYFGCVTAYVVACGIGFRRYMYRQASENPIMNHEARPPAR